MELSIITSWKTKTMKDLKLTPLEQRILFYSTNSAITHRRRTTVLITGIATAILLAGVAWLKQSWQFVLIVSLIYIVFTVFEKVAYANAVLAYKSLIQKLKNRVDELESENNSQQKTESDGRKQAP